MRLFKCIYYILPYIYELDSVYKFLLKTVDCLLNTAIFLCSRLVFETSPLRWWTYYTTCLLRRILISFRCDTDRLKIKAPRIKNLEPETNDVCAFLTPKRTGRNNISVINKNHLRAQTITCCSRIHRGV